MNNDYPQGIHCFLDLESLLAGESNLRSPEEICHNARVGVFYLNMAHPAEQISTFLDCRSSPVSCPQAPPLPKESTNTFMP